MWPRPGSAVAAYSSICLERTALFCALPKSDECAPVSIPTHTLAARALSPATQFYTNYSKSQVNKQCAVLAFSSVERGARKPITDPTYSFADEQILKEIFHINWATGKIECCSEMIELNFFTVYAWYHTVIFASFGYIIHLARLWTARTHF